MEEERIISTWITDVTVIHNSCVSCILKHTYLWYSCTGFAKMGEYDSDEIGQEPCTVFQIEQYFIITSFCEVICYIKDKCNIQRQNQAKGSQYKSHAVLSLMYRKHFIM
jgi:hypothetical protein